MGVEGLWMTILGWLGDSEDNAWRGSLQVNPEQVGAVGPLLSSKERQPGSRAAPVPPDHRLPPKLTCC